MKFGTVPTRTAEGAILAHSVRLSSGVRLRKGMVLGIAHLADLAGDGHDTVIVARLEDGDVPEDAAADRIGAALCSAGLRMAEAATGRVNLYAEAAGVVDVAASPLNAVDPLIGLATTPRWQRVAAGDMVATLKIIAYAVPEASVAAAVAAAQDALTLWPPRLGTAVLIETTVDGETPSPKGRAATEARLARLGVTLGPRLVVAHRTQPIAEAIAASTEELVLILTASATSDPHDVAPAAVVAAGGRIERFGMPVDPGNLLFLGDVAGRPVIGLPGCARSPALNGADWVLERVICGVPVTAADIADMGTGGLLKEVAARGRPREA